jgi:hypothetical protein
MTAKKHVARVAIQQASVALVAEVSDGRWRHVSGLSGKPAEQWTEILAELERLCPSHSKEEYVDALKRAIWNNR